MSNTEREVFATKRQWLSLDGWAVLLAFALAALVRAGVFKHVPW